MDITKSGNINTKESGIKKEKREFENKVKREMAISIWSKLTICVA